MDEQQILNQAEQVYRDCSKTPSVATATMLSNDNSKNLQVVSEWSQRNLDTTSMTQFSLHHHIHLTDDGNIEKVEKTHTLPFENSYKQISYSETGKLKAVLKLEKIGKADQESQILSIWSTECLLHSFNLTSVKKHGKAIVDATFASLVWSPDEKYILYVAEKEKKSLKTYFDSTVNDIDDKDSNGDANETKLNKLDKFIAEETWGEREPIHQPVLAILEISTGAIRILDTPSNVSPGQAIWSRDGSGIVYVGWDNEPWRLGVIYCSNRRNSLYYISLDESECEHLTDGSRTIYSPRFNPQGTKLVYMSYLYGGPHHSCAALMQIDWNSRKSEILIETVSQTNGSGFCGIYSMELPKRCWSADGNKLYFHTVRRIYQDIYEVNTIDKKLSCITKDNERGCWSILDVYSNILLASFMSPSIANRLMIAAIPYSIDSNLTSLHWTEIETIRVPSDDRITWEVITLTASDSASINEFDVIFCMPEGVAELPLIVVPHGGPHSAFYSYYNIYYYCFCKLGYAILQVNYRGSSGYGQKGIDCLLGNVGTLDVTDMKLAVDHILANKKVIGQNIYVFGGSHGGFLGTHMIGQFPSLFKACAVRNPVTDIASMLNVTDIPDWCYVEAGFDWNFGNIPSSDVYTKMINVSPMAHISKVQTPTLILLGQEDARVPPYQGRELYRALKARGVETRLLSYPGNNHSLSEVECEADVFMNVISWFNRHR